MKAAVGLDIGNSKCVVAVSTAGVTDAVLNQDSKRETPTVVHFADNHRLFGTAAASYVSTKPESTISQLKRLVGLRFEGENYRKERLLLPYETVESDDERVSVKVHYLNEDRIFTAVEMLAMLFAQLKRTAKQTKDFPMSNCVIGVPSYFSDEQKDAYRHAALIAGWNPLGLLHEGVATALAYAAHRSDYDAQSVVAFVDVGHCDTQITVARFRGKDMEVLGEAWYRDVGGRDFDEVIFQHFMGVFENQYRRDIRSNVKACVRLRTACEKAKRVLSANKEADVSIDYLMEGVEYASGVITRDKFEELSQGLLGRLRGLFKIVLDTFNVDVNGRIDSVELVGSGSRIPAISRILTGLFKRNLSRTLNGSECVARGCALLCEKLMTSPEDPRTKEIISRSGKRVALYPSCKMDINYLSKSISQERELQNQDRSHERAKDKRNDLKPYVNEVRKELKEIEEWLYGEGDDESQDVYGNKLERLRSFIRGLQVQDTADVPSQQTPVHSRKFLTSDLLRGESSRRKSLKTEDMTSNEKESTNSHGPLLTIGMKLPVGLDIGNSRCVVAVSTKGVVAAVRETPSVVHFAKKHRIFGSAAASCATDYPASTISQIKRLVWLRFEGEKRQNERLLLPYETVESDYKRVSVKVHYLNEDRIFTAVDMLAMLFAQLKRTADHAKDPSMSNCVIGVPSYLTDEQKDAYWHAALIAGWNPLGLLHEGVATALDYAAHRSDDDAQSVVAFVDIGHCDTQVTVVRFLGKDMEVLGEAWDRNLGGRDFDEVIFQHFVGVFEDQYGRDIRSDVKASVRLRSACEEVKRVLSANKEGDVSIDYLMEGVEYASGVITRDKFEELSQGLLGRLGGLFKIVLDKFHVDVNRRIDSVELVGYGSRIPAISRILTGLFKRDLSRTLKGSECVARGCALLCERLMTSPEDSNTKELIKRMEKRVALYNSTKINTNFLSKSTSQETDLQNQDRSHERAKDKRNDLESYIYEVRKERNARSTSEAHEEKISEKLKEIEEWLYGEGDDESEDVYVNKLEDLKSFIRDPQVQDTVDVPSHAHKNKSKSPCSSWMSWKNWRDRQWKVSRQRSPLNSAPQDER